MAHSFDYSASAGPLGQGPGGGIALTQLFGSFSGSLITQSYGRSGVVSDSVVIRTPDGSLTTQSAAVNAFGNFTPTGPQIDQPYDSDLLARAPARFAEELGQFGYAGIEPGGTRGFYATFEGIPSPRIAFDLPDGVVDFSMNPVGDALAAVQPAMLAEVNAILAGDLASLPGIRLEAWTIPGTIASPDLVLDYTPDPGTDLILRDLVNTAGLEGPGANAFAGFIGGTRTVFSSEDVEIRMTSGGDTFRNTVLSTDMGDLTLRAAEGDDAVTLLLSTPALGSRPDARRIELFMGPGDDDGILTVDGHDDVRLRGGAGDDDVRINVFRRDGDAGTREIDGGGGDDVVVGSTGSDRLSGGAGNDQIVGANPVPGDPTPQGPDTLSGGDGSDTIIDAFGDDLVLAGDGDDRMNLNIGDDTLFGGAGTDIYRLSVGNFQGSSPGSSGTFGPGGDVIVDDGGFLDVLTGGGVSTPGMRRLGQDLELDLGGNLLRFVGFYGSPEGWTARGVTVDGTSAAFAPFSFDAARGLAPATSVAPTLVLPEGDGTEADDALSGTEGADWIDLLGGNDFVLGLGGADRLNGGEGADTLDGGTGADLLIGGIGSDRIIVDDGGDRVVENRGWEGQDTVISSVDIRIGRAHIEEIMLTGEAQNASGNRVFQRIVGNDEDNILNGGAGNDTLVGGAGDDTYIVRAPGDTVVERAGEGIDLVRSTRTWRLEDHIEKLELLPTRRPDGSEIDGLKGFGNALDNVIKGNPFENTLVGRGGNDTLVGGDGADRFLFDRAPGRGNVDRVLDFDASEGDRLLFRRDAFDNLRKGGLSDALLRDGPQALDGNDRFVWNEANGRLFFDADGGGAGGQRLVAIFAPGTEIEASDIFLV